MKVLMLNTHDKTGGAARAMYRISQALIDSNVDVSIWCDHKTSDESFIKGPTTIYEKILSKIRPSLDRLPLKLFYSQRKKYPWGINSISYGLSKKISREPFDLVHLHWISYGFIGIDEISKIKQPLIWTMHDMWGITGGCHYTYGCIQHLSECGNCPQLKSKKATDLSNKMYQKRKALLEKRKDLVVVAPSEWLLNEVKQSPLYKNHRCIHIPYPIDTELWHPHNKIDSRKTLGLPLDKKIILFTAMSSTTDARKGSQFLPKMLQELSQNYSDDEVELLVVGATHGNIPTPFKVHYLGHLFDDNTQSIVYSSSDVTVTPSTQDNLPNVVIESLSCGTPVVAFNIGGMPDMIEHEISGYLAKAFEAKDLAQGVQFVLNKNDTSLNTNARNSVLKKYSYKKIAMEYLELYKTMLK